MKPMDRIGLWNGGYVESYDFTQANSSHAARVEAVCEVAKVCRGIKTIKNPEKLYQRLLTEHAGKPSEILSFIPVWGAVEAFASERFLDVYHPRLEARSNLRNVSKGILQGSTRSDPATGFLVFKIKIPYMVVDHLRRHQMLNFSIAENWQSNRSGHKREYYLPNDFKECPEIPEEQYHSFMQDISLGFLDQLQLRHNLRQEITNKGEFGLRYTTGFIAGWVQDPYAWRNFFSVRLHKPTQLETKELACAMQALIPHELKSKYLVGV